MKYVIDIDIEENDCSFCPCFMRPEYSYAICNLAERDLEPRSDMAKDGKNYVMCYDRPDWCPLSLLADSHEVAKPYVNHGDHGPEPRFKGDAWTMWYCCGNCDHAISPYDNYCKTCGAKIDWSDCV